MRRVISLVLSVLMVFSMIPASAFAAAPAMETEVQTPLEVVKESGGTELQAQASVNGVTVTVKSPADAFPAGTIVNIRPVRGTALKAYSDVVLANMENGSVMAAFDITFTKDGEELQPKEGSSVDVRFMTENDGERDYSVWHVDDKATEAKSVAAEKTVEDGNDVLQVKGTEFSVYVLSSVQSKFTTYHFYDASGAEMAEYEQIVKVGDTLAAPEIPDKDEHHVFTGWHIGSPSGTVFDAWDAPATGATSVDLYPAFEEIYYIFFMEKPYEAASVYLTQTVQGDEISNAVELISTDHYKSQSGGVDYFFKDWYYDAALTDKVTGGVVDLEHGSAGTKHDVFLYPERVSGYWLYFDSGEGTYCEPVFVPMTETTVAPTAPTCPGYTFVRWSETPGGSAYAFGTPLTCDKTLYAVWTASATTNYTLVHWLENSDNDNYSFYKDEVKTGTTGSTVTAVGGTLPTGYASTGSLLKDADGRIIYDADGKPQYTANVYETGIVAGDGSTIINVYYKRAEYQVKFYNTSNTLIDELTITAKYGSYIGDQWPSWRTGLSKTYGANWRTSRSGNTMQAGISVMPLNGTSFWETSASGNEFNVWFYTDYEQTGVKTITNGGKTWYFHHVDNFTYNASSLSITKEDHYDIDGYTWTGGIAKNGSSLRKGEEGVTFLYTRNEYNVDYKVYDYSTSTYKTGTVKYKFKDSLAGLENKNPHDVTSDVNADGTRIISGATYEFRGWFDNEKGYGEPITASYFASSTMPSHTITLYACYEKKEVVAEVNLKIHTSSNADPRSYTVPAGTSVAENIPNLQEIENELMSLKSEGTTWIGWEREINGQYESFNIRTRIYEDTKIYPAFIYGGELYVTYDLNGGTGTAPSYAYTFFSGSRAKVLAPEAVTAPAGKYFAGWSYNGQVYYPGNPIKLESKDIILTAVWSDKPETTSIIYYANDGSDKTLVTGPFKINETTTAESINTVVGGSYVYPSDEFFFGWSSTETGAAEYMAGEDIVADNKNTSNGVNKLYAQWNEPLEITVTAPSLTVAYDGTAHTVSGIEKTVRVVDPTAVVDTTAVATFSSGTVTFEYNRRTFDIPGVTSELTETAAGTYTITPTGPAIVRDPYTSKMLVITYVPGELNIEKRDLTITGATDTLNFTGSELAITSFTASGLQSGHKLTGLTYRAAGTDVDISTGYDGVFYESGSPVTDVSQIKVYDASDNDVTANYNITYTPGKLYITNAVEVTVELKGFISETVYNGAEQTVDGYEVIVRDSEGNVLDQQIVTNVTGLSATVSGTNVGTYTMPAVDPATIGITLANGYELASNGVKFTPGKLVISKKALTITGASATVKRTGSNISLTSYYAAGLCGTDTISGLTYSATGRNNGTYDGTFTPNSPSSVVILNSSSANVAGNYEITLVPGTLTIAALSGTVQFTIHYREQGTNNVIRSDESKYVSSVGSLNLGDIGCDDYYEYDFYYDAEANHPDIEGYTYSGWGVDSSKVKARTYDGDNVGKDPVNGHYYVPGTSVNNLDTSNGTGGSNEIYIYYTKAAVNAPYVIEFYYDGVQDTSLTVSGTALSGSTIDAENYTGGSYTNADLVTLNTKDGYLFKNNRPTSITMGEDQSENYIRVDYIRDNTKYGYTVEYYYDGALGETYTASDAEKLAIGKQVTSYSEKLKTGYKLDANTGDNGVVGLPLTITTTESNNVIKVYYVKDSFSYSVNFYVESVLDSTNSYADSAEYGATITAAAAEGTYDPGDGYVLQYTPDDLVISENASSNVMSFYYVKRTDLSYTVTYTLKGTTTELAAAKDATGKTFGDVITENAIAIPGYKLADGCAASKDITITTGTNTANFEYEMRDDLGYTIQYLNKKDNSPLAAEEEKIGKTWLETYTVEAKEITGYMVDSEVKTVKVSSEDVAENVVTFYYQEEGTGQYTINYYLYGSTGTAVRVATTVTGKTVGTTVSVSPEEVSGYTIAPNTVMAGNDTVRSLLIKDDATQNVVDFYYLKNLIVAAESLTVEYDAQPHTIADYKVYDANGAEVTEITPLEGVTVTGTTGTDRGTYVNQVSGVTKGFIAPDYYVYAVIDGQLVITERTIIVKSASADKLYDGTALVDNSFIITDADGVTALYLLPGHVLSAQASGSQTDVGSSANTIDYVTVVEEVGGADVSENYNIITVPGALTVSPTVPGLVVTAGNYTGTYDAAEHKGEDEGFTFTFNNSDDKKDEFSAKYDLVPAFSAASTITHTGVVANVIDSIAVYDKVNDPGHTHDLIANFDFQINAGTLTVNPVELTITAESSTTTDLAYVRGEETLTATSISGNPYGYTINGAAGMENFPIASEKNYFTVTVTGSQTGVGSCASVAAYSFANDGEGPDIYMADYYIETVDGVLEVINEDETVTYEAPYDSPTVTTDNAIIKQGVNIIVDPNGGTWTNPDETALVPVTGETNTYTVMDDVDLGQPIPPTGKTFTGWALDETSGTKVFTANYEDDILGGDDPTDPAYPGDGVPDKYQFPVTFKIGKGSWTSDTSDVDDITRILTRLDGSGKWSTTASVKLTSEQIPTGMQAFTGYGNGAWDVTPNTTTALDAETTYTYTFVANDQTVTYDDNTDPNAPATTPADVKYDEEIKVLPNGGTWTQAANLEAVTGKDDTYTVKGDVDLGTPTAPTGKVFTGWTLSYEDTTKVFTANYEDDTVGGDDPTDPAYPGDGIPDKYQFAVTFKIVKGSWTSDSSDTADKTEYLTKVDDSDMWSTTGSAKLIAAQIPTGMQAFTGYGNGAWDVTPDTTTALSAETTYTYTFVANDQTVTYDDNTDPNAPATTPADVKYDEEIKVLPNGGTWTQAANLEAVTGKDDTYTVKGDVDLGTPTAPTGKVFTGWTLSYEDATKVFTANYENDTVGGDDPTDPAYPGDGIPDKYQFTVTFKIVKGSWTDSASDTADKIEYLTKVDDSGMWSTTGSGKLIAAQIPAVASAKAVTGYGDGAWDGETPDTTTALTGEKTYTYKFVALDQDVTYQKPINSEAAPENGTDKIKYDSKIKVDPGDSTVCAGWTAPSTLEATSEPQVYIVKGTVALAKPIAQPGKIFTGWLSTTDPIDGMPLYVAQYEDDVLGGDDPTDPAYPGDGIPDKYQFTVTFKVVKGSWTSTVTDVDDKVEYLTKVDGTGKWSETGSAKLTAAQIPGSMQAFTGYGNGAWDVTPNTTTALSAETTYTYTFVANDQTVTYDDDVDPNAPATTPADVKYDEEIKVVPGEGTWTKPDTLEEVTGKDDTYTVKGDVDLGTPTAPAGKVFTGWTLTDEDGTKVFTAVYEDDTIGGTDPTTGAPVGDGIPDKYQFAVTFKVVKGSWSSDASDVEDKECILTKVDGTGKWTTTGSAKLTASQIPGSMQAFTGYGNGAWDVTPDTTTELSAETTYTYTFVANDQTVTYDDDVDPNAPAITPADVKYDEEIKVVPGEGTWTKPDTLEEVTGKDDTYAVKGDVDLGTPTAPAGEVFTGWTLTDDDGTKVFTAVYEDDTIGDTDPTTGAPVGDGIPDKYQFAITFKVVNGSWTSDSSDTADKIEYLTMVDSTGKWTTTGSAKLTASQIPGSMQAFAGYDIGAWDVTPDTTAELSAAATYTYTFGPATYNVTLVPGPGTIESGKDVTEYTHDTDKALPGADDVEYEGYTFAGWYENDTFTGDAISTIPGSSIGDKTYYAKWTANTDTPYTVNHFKADSKGEYAALPDDTDALTGTTDAQTAATAKDYEGFQPVITGEKAWSQTTVTGDGLAVVNIYYERKTYETEYSGGEDANNDGEFDPITESGLRYEDRLIVDPNGGQWTAPAGWTENSGKYETILKGNVTVADPTHAEDDTYFYSFGGWDKSDTTDPTTGVRTLELTALWIKVTTKVNVEVQISAELEGDVVADKEDLEALAIAELKKAIAAQGTKRISELDITMTVTSVETVTQQQASVQDQLNAIRAIAEGRTLEFFQIVINMEITYMTWNGSAWVVTETVTSPITDTVDPIAITLPYDTTLKNNLAVYRYHDGEGACEFGEKANAAGEFSEIGTNSFTVHACKFSIYAIGYYPVSTDPDTFSATVTLTDNVSGEPIPGAVFKVCKTDGTVLGTAQTDANGKVVFDGLPAGKYYIVETKAPYGYVTDATKMEFNVVTSDAELTMGNDRLNVPTMLNSTDHYSYVFGYTDGTVRPEKNISRAEVAAIFYRLLKAEIREANETTVCSYTDISGDEWYVTEVATMTALGIVTGYPDGSFKPDAPITRAELATIASKFSDYAGEVDATFTDIAGIWSESFIKQSATLGWVSGYTDNTFKPDNYITRAETIALVNNVLQRRPEMADDLLEGMKEWPDNADESAWYYLAIQEATTSHNYEAKGQGYETWTEVLPNVTIMDAAGN